MKRVRELSASTVWGEGPSDVMAFSIDRGEDGTLLHASYIDLDTEEVDAFVCRLLEARTEALRLKTLMRRDVSLDLFEARIRANKFTVVSQGDMWCLYSEAGTLLKAFSTLARMVGYILEDGVEHVQ